MENAFHFEMTKDEGEVVQMDFGGRNVVAGCHIPSAVMVSGLDH